MDEHIIVVGYPALSGALRLLVEEHEALADYFSASFLKQAKAEIEGAVLPAQAQQWLSHCPLDIQLFPCGDRGILGCFWDIKKQNRIGLSFSVRLLPMIQAVVELTEHFHINPYQFESQHCFVVLTQAVHEFIEQTKDWPVPVTVIGSINDSKQIADVGFEKPRFITKNPRKWEGHVL